MSRLFVLIPPPSNPVDALLQHDEVGEVQVGGAVS